MNLSVLDVVDVIINRSKGINALNI